MDALGELWDFLSTESNWWGRNGIATRTWAHVRISVLALVLSAAIAIPPAVVLGHIKRGGLAAVSVVNIGRALPSFGILALAFPLSIQLGLGLGFWPTLVPLVFLGIPPIFMNAYTGVRGVDPGVVESANGMGLTARQVLWQVELPIAIPLMVTGLRVSAVQIVATATLGALVGFSALGSFITEGIAQFDDGKMLTGGLLVALLAILTEVGFSLLERSLTPWSRSRRGTEIVDEGSETPTQTAPAVPGRTVT
ncbi:ABC transporter permease [Actinomarinicola tropica]|uniref:ABC transporter permease subunit n=1 Tax=Actinomarinicola tropica TaxID=2789776 RepID=A0A5Q2RFY1_9ACTN|nr:ABC transporter permease [Actinomarinicola tropica]QGG93712.1 ABC transporter permease subunit [Actinomarinicola tropica]